MQIPMIRKIRSEARTPLSIPLFSTPGGTKVSNTGFAVLGSVHSEGIWFGGNSMHDEIFGYSVSFKGIPALGRQV
jgi:hypothetical protein